MQVHLKERLTGAALLVLVVVLLVPEMFRGRPVIAPPPTGVALGEAPLRSYTIDLRDNEVAQPLPAGAPLSTGVPPAAGESAAGAPLASGTTTTVAAPARMVPPPSAAAAPAPAHGTTGWTVQVGTFSRRDYAERMVRQLKAKGIATQVAGPDDRGLYRVRSARFSDFESAVALRDQLRGKGLKPIVNALP